MKDQLIRCPTCHYEHDDLSKAETRKLEKEWSKARASDALFNALFKVVSGEFRSIKAARRWRKKACGGYWADAIDVLAKAEGKE